MIWRFVAYHGHKDDLGELFQMSEDSSGDFRAAEHSPRFARGSTEGKACTYDVVYTCLPRPPPEVSGHRGPGPHPNVKVPHHKPVAALGVTMSRVVQSAYVDLQCCKG